MPLSAGTRLGPYEILSALGVGGMGEVYRARDTKLGREVALKILSDSFTHDPERIARFHREAQVLAALNHPHIGAIYGLDETNGQQFLVLELIDGVTLADRIAKGPLPVDEALAIAKQIAQALEAAHEKGITHRDLKPANIALTKDGNVKVLDFGLAKPTGGASSTSIDLANSPTLTSPAMMTGVGVILGTAAYMSPEQARGKLVDKRSDIWAFGCVLYEMLTGDRMFKGDDVTEVLAAVVMTEPNLSVAPPQVRRLLAKCVEKDPQRRLRDLGDAWELLESGQAVAPSRSRLASLGWMIAVALGVLAAIGWLRTPFGASHMASTTLTIVPPADTLLRPAGDLGSAPQISPDGSAVMYEANAKVYVRLLDSLTPKLVSGSEEVSNAPFWCADSATVVFPTVHQVLMKVRLPDGAPEVLAQRLTSRGGSCGETGAILISRGITGFGLGLVAEPLYGGSGEDVKSVEARGMPMGLAYNPEFLPGGEDFLFLFSPRDHPDEQAIYLATLRNGQVVDPVLLLKNPTAAHYTPAGGGRILFVRNDNLYAQRLNRTARKLEGEAGLVTQSVASQPGMTVYRADFSVARNGTVAWRPGRAALSQVSMFDRQGHTLGTAGPPAAVHSLLLSPDGTRVLAIGERAWLLNAGQTGRLPIPDGSWFGWAHNGSTLFGRAPSQHLIALSTTSAEVRDLGETTIRGYPNDLSPDGNHVLSSLIGGRGIFATRLRGTPEEGTSRLVVQPGDDAVFSPRFSPDGRWIAFESGGLFIQPFPGPGLRRQIASTGIAPEWCNDGREIVYVSRLSERSSERTLMSVTLDAVGSPRGAPHTLFSGLRMPAGANRGSRPLAVSRDCSRIFFPQAVEQPDSNVIHIKAGWVR